MKIEFNDGSFISLDTNEYDEEMLTIVMCGLEGKKATMSASSLNYDQVSEIIEFLRDWQKNQDI